MRVDRFGQAGSQPAVHDAYDLSAEASRPRRSSRRNEKLRAVRAAGVNSIGGKVEAIDLSDPRPLERDEVLISVKAAGVANWDDLVRTGGWQVGSKPPMALGVSVAGEVAAVGDGVSRLEAGSAVLGHPVPLRGGQGAWAEWMIAPADLLASKPDNVSWEAAGAFPVPALTAEQVLTEALGLQEGETLLVHGAGGVTGGLIVQLAALRGANVLATAGPRSADRVQRLGAVQVLDYNDRGWVDTARQVGVDAAANTAREGEQDVLATVRDGGRFVTITGAPPDEERGISIMNLYVRSDGEQLGRLASLLGEGRLKIAIASVHPLAEAGEALAAAKGGAGGGAVVVTP
jgi:NADPH:quinone reductase-like Zn-dependent oxidoreductase